MEFPTPGRVRKVPIKVFDPLFEKLAKPAFNRVALLPPHYAPPPTGVSVPVGSSERETVDPACEYGWAFVSTPLLSSSHPTKLGLLI